MAEESKTSYIRKASLIALVGNSVLAALKLIAGYVSGSLAVVGDGIDSIVDVAIAIMILFVSRFVAQPADKEHPWGHGRAETVASLVLACMLFFAGAELVRSSIVNLVQRPGRELPDIMAIIVTLVSIAGKTLLALSQKHYAKKAASPLLRANAKDMLADVLLSVGVLIGLVFSYVFRTSIIDTIAAILVGLWVIKSSIEVFTENNRELMDGGATDESYNLVFTAVKAVEGVKNPHRTRMRKTGGLWDIDIDIEVQPDITVREAHGIAVNVEKAIRNALSDVFDIVVHVEPYGDNRAGEQYGVSK